MNRILTTLIILTTWLSPLFAQHKNLLPAIPHYPDSTAILTPMDELMLQQVTRLKLSEAEQAISLPSSVNNATHPWMIPIFWQSGNECGQASSICYTLSYELLRRRNQDYMWGYDFQYPSRFAWNFCNKGENVGVNFMESWEVIRTAGTPTVNEWGGWYNTGEVTHWISGYDIYHNAMRNRITEMYAIPTNTEEGLLTLKHWLYDHLNGESSGGLANFYCTYRGNDYLSTIPAGSPQAGKHILTGFTTNVNHAKTIVGYDDDVRWDYNGDGLFTNDIDINGDGIVDMRDWEVGAVIFCNTFGPDFGDDGYCYLPYCKLASLPAEEGIWNTCVYVVQVKDEVFPQITYKATIQHTSREKIHVLAGVASNPAATHPEHTLDFYVFHNQGGDHYMQGSESPADKTLEFGLDVSPLLNYITPGQPSKFFLHVVETDTSNEADGLIVNFSLMDYTSGAEVEQAHPSTNVPIVNNDTTTLALTRSIYFSRPVIQDSLLPAMTAFSDYAHQLSATGGKPSYRWEVDRNFHIEEFTETFPVSAGQNVPLSDIHDGYAIIPLDFDFPYYGDRYNNLVVYADGYIAFHHQPANWPFLQHTDMQTAARRMICPFKCNLQNCSVYKQVTDDCIALYFTAKVAQQNGSSVNFVVRLYRNGTIEYLYGDMVYNSIPFWSALVRGDQQVLQHLPVSGVPASQIQHRSFRMTPWQLPQGLTLSPSGRISGKSTTAFSNHPCSVVCYDNNDVKDTKIVYISCDYESRLAVTSCKINGSENPYLYIGDTLHISIAVKNLDTIAYTGCNLRIQSNDPCLQWLDSTEYFGYIAPNNEYLLNGCATCILSPNTPAQHQIELELIVDNELSASHTTRTYIIHNYDILLQNYTIGNESQMFLTNDTVPVSFTLKNNGYALHNITLKSRYEDPNLLPLLDSIHFNELGLEAIFQFPTIIYANANFIQGTNTDAYLDVYIGNRLVSTVTVPILGERPCLGFEDGMVPSFTTGENTQPLWVIDTANAYTGQNSLVNGNISHNQSTTFQFTSTLSQAQEISFAFKTSTEAKYDWLYFYIDGEQKDRWAGVNDWTKISYLVSEGPHTFTWKYEKDYSVSSGEDKVWIDDICLMEPMAPSAPLSIQPSDIEVELGLYNHTTEEVELHYQNPSSEALLFVNHILDENGQQPVWVTCSSTHDFIESNDVRNIQLQFNSFDCIATDYEATLLIRFTGGYEEVPLRLRVHDDVGINGDNVGLQVRLYPNPTHNRCTIACEEQPIDHILLFDTFGRLLQNIPVHTTLQSIDLSSLPAGIYVIKTILNDQTTNLQRIVKQ